MPYNTLEERARLAAVRHHHDTVMLEVVIESTIQRLMHPPLQATIMSLLVDGM
ncbi:hypothetical protein [Nonomuraea sp. NPDC003709]|uniref:hypothetical protein n=1 Tax=Nonomuraea sp. NPDC003709 TaxID=3154450 RepID=UPI0033BC94EC